MFHPIVHGLITAVIILFQSHSYSVAKSYAPVHSSKKEGYIGLLATWPKVQELDEYAAQSQAKSKKERPNPVVYSRKVIRELNGATKRETEFGTLFCRYDYTNRDRVCRWLD